jgi:nitroreductase
MTNQFLRKAPVVIVGCEKSSGIAVAAAGVVLKSVGARDSGWGDVDVAIAMEHMVLTATDLGVGSCWVWIFDERRISRILDMPEDQRIIALLALGYPTVPIEDSPMGIGKSPRVPMRDISKII